ncbi:TRADD-N-associated membrane domain-containing protein [Nocardia salmonicida]|uniref:TRADD-N-associated membrane domain-containing protein n=1 Tax=Nocardia salmonicida TaxID=53431 RepID=UPI003407A2E0
MNTTPENGDATSESAQPKTLDADKKRFEAMIIATAKARDENTKAAERLTRRTQLVGIVGLGSVGFFLVVGAGLIAWWAVTADNPINQSASQDTPPAAAMWSAPVAAAVGVVGLLATRWLRDRKERQSRDAVDRAIAKVTDPFDLMQLMEVNRRQMEVYDDQARNQSSTSHWTALGAMVAGLSIVGFGIGVAANADSDATKFATAIIAAVGTTVGGYIAKTFITLNSSTQEQVRYYFEQPLVASYLITAERFIARMPEEDRPEQYRRLVQAAMDQAAAVKGAKQTPVTKPPRRMAARRSAATAASDSAPTYETDS